jgi:hypothetical protein
MSLHDDVTSFFYKHKRGTLEPAASVDLHHVAHAVEDLPLHAHDKGKRLLGSEFGARFQNREFDELKHSELNELKSIVAHAGGELEEVLPFLAHYPVTDYRYEVSQPFLTRGDRPDVSKLNYLADQTFTATLNLCRETPEGDRPLIVKAGLTDRLEPLHVGIVDGTPPTRSQVTQILGLLVEREARGGQRVYLHCEAGKGRTGVIVACYRMAVMGWGVEDALVEATNFGCSTPAQLQFIADFGDRLIGFPGYPRRGLGDVRATQVELEATLAGCAARPV